MRLINGKFKNRDLIPANLPSSGDTIFPYISLPYPVEPSFLNSNLGTAIKRHTGLVYICLLKTIIYAINVS